LQKTENNLFKPMNSWGQVMSNDVGKDTVKVSAEALQEFVAQVLAKLEVPAPQAVEAAEVLVNADVRGVDSHGVARLPYYVDRLDKGLIEPVTDIRLVREGGANILVDGGNGLGQLVSKRTMEICIEKAGMNGSCMAAVRNSNHFGAAAYYAMMALPHHMVGISMTNAYPLQPPTFGKKAMIGANPMAVAIPAGTEAPFVLDMSTSTVAFGKLEIANREGMAIPHGWALDKDGNPTTDPQAGMEGRTLLPLGGTRELGGHKGYGLALMVEILCGVLSGAAFGLAFVEQGLEVPMNLGRAISLEAFSQVERFKDSMDDMLAALKASSPAQGQERVYTAGELEYLCERERRQTGIPLNRIVADNLRQIGGRYDVTCPV
jgi:LDH2 family malate/lactate/ureidoglycolate dehydrogenase